MALNNAFTVSQTLTATEMNNLPFGVADHTSSASDDTLSTSLTASLGMSVTWTADSTRLYKITYYEPQVRSSSVLSSYVDLELRQTNVSGTQLQQIFVGNVTAAVITTESATVTYIGTFSSGSRTVIGAALVSSTTGAPKLLRSGTSRAYIICEDVGLA
mgnify:CR=1 FL=1|tara:strand:+ start:343 stop:819 length:477 start_codon:yes stop_codon:yes gene_type:complete